MLSHENLWFAGKAGHDAGYVPGIVRSLTALPLSHAFGLLVTVVGFHVREPHASVLMRWFQPDAWLELASRAPGPDRRGRALDAEAAARRAARGPRPLRAAPRGLRRRAARRPRPPRSCCAASRTSRSARATASPSRRRSSPRRRPAARGSARSGRRCRAIEVRIHEPDDARRGRDPRPLALGDARLLAGAGADRRGAARRLAAHGRPRAASTTTATSTSSTARRT